MPREFTIVRKHATDPPWLAYHGRRDNGFADYVADSREELALKMGINVALIPEEDKLLTKTPSKGPSYKCKTIKI